MFLIPCPWCGTRADHEFICTGEARRPLPADEGSAPPEGVTDTWPDRLYGRDNPRGWVQELWWHVHGCQQWLQVDRHTVTHEIASVQPARDAGGRP